MRLAMTIGAGDCFATNDDFLHEAHNQLEKAQILKQVQDDWERFLGRSPKKPTISHAEFSSGSGLIVNNKIFLNKIKISAC